MSRQTYLTEETRLEGLTLSTPVTRHARPFRLAVVVTNPIQHFVPMYSKMATLDGLVLRVIFGNDGGLSPVFDKGFGRTVQWEGLDVSSFDHQFLGLTGGGGTGAAGSVWPALDAFDAEGVLVYGYSQGISLAAFSWAVRRGRRVLYVSDSERRQDISRLREALKYPFVRAYLARADAVMSVGDANEEYYEFHGVPPRKLIRAGFPIDLEIYEAALSERESLRARTRKKLGVSDQEVVILNVGKMVPWKRQEAILAAMDDLGAEGSTIVAVLAGSGPEEAALRLRATHLQHGRVLFPGFVSAADLPSLYAAADIYVHPSDRDRHSLAITEATFMGCPVVLSDRCGSWGPSDDVRPGVNGYVYPVGDVPALASALRRLVAAPGLRQEFSARSSEGARGMQERAHGRAWIEAIQSFRADGGRIRRARGRDV